jgi:hypothetical protein
MDLPTRLVGLQHIGFPIAFVDLLLIRILSYIMDLPARLVGLQHIRKVLHELLPFSDYF